MAAPRNLTLTEELEKLEQSITLTLQEIDHNFSRAHRIVTASILPVVEQYAKHSEAVWEGSKFWKQFFEASANVSLSGYEEAAVDESAHDETAASHGYDDITSTTAHAEDTMTGATPPMKPSSHGDLDDLEESLLDSPSLTHAHSTPRMPGTASKRGSGGATFADFPSPYEALKREVQGGDEEPAADPTTPGKQQALPDMTMTPESSPFGAPPTSTRPTNTDPLLHRVLDKTYRIAATPHTARKNKAAAALGATPGTTSRTRLTARFDSSPLSSPIAAPQLRADIFSSPMKTPRTPGVSVLRTPGRKDGTGGAFGKSPAFLPTGGTVGAGAWDSEEEGEEEIDFSPPKTMQFHVPQSRLLQTPAREASKRIVEDLLMTAGGDITDELDEDSPSVVRRNHELDDSF